MPKNVIFYARYSTDRQDEQSIETQIELGRALAAERGWNLVEIYEDRAISGTSKSRTSKPLGRATKRRSR